MANTPSTSTDPYFPNTFNNNEARFAELYTADGQNAKLASANTFTENQIIQGDEGGAFPYQFLVRGATDNNKQISLGFDTTNNYGILQAHEVGSGAFTTPLLLNPNGGNVGIGTTSPEARLHTRQTEITGTGYIGEANAIIEGIDGCLELVSNREGGYASTLALTSTDGTNYNNWAIVNGGTTASGRLRLMYGTTQANTLGNINQEFMSVSTTGNVGINTTSPTERLDVNGKIRMRTQTVVGDASDIVSTKGYTEKQRGSVFLDNFLLSQYKIIPFSGNGLAGTILTSTANRQYYIPFILSGDRTISELSATITTAGSGKFRLGIYGNSSNRPGSLIVQSGDLSNTTTGNKTFATSQTLLGGNVYWLAVLSENGAFRGVPTGGLLALLGFNSNSNMACTHYYQAITSGWTEMPASAGTLTTGVGIVPAIYIV